MNFHKLFKDEVILKNKITFFIKSNQIEEIPSNPLLVKSHMEKAEHNMRFFSKNLDDEKYVDWLIVTLYYALYHAALALLTNKNYISKNHTATILILIQEYAITKDEVELISELAINKDDAELYTNLKSDRHDASYATNSKFTISKVMQYQKEVINFIQKAQAIINSK